ncbi:hypothetical protein ACFY2R_18350 [Micromonospora olivasterospora]|uniref:hypothetical protein n=1 Tax=Micromonospora olivasterospora TaxID=1880 RepID=UPI00147976E8
MRTEVMPKVGGGLEIVDRADAGQQERGQAGVAGDVGHRGDPLGCLARWTTVS